MPDITLVWAGLIAFAVLAYVVLDGFDLGIGILFPWFRSEADRDLMTNTIAPVWDGNETWLVLGGGGLLAVFPLAYATIMPALYAPVIAMLLGLIFRGVAFEFRWRTRRIKRGWDIGFSAGSMVAGFAQGVALGALVQGIEVENRAYAGGWFDWATPFTLLTGVALVTGYALLGACWLVLKTEGAVRERARAAAGACGIGLIVLIVLVSAATPLLHPYYLQRWFGWPTVAFSALVPALLVLCVWQLRRGLRHGPDHKPFLAALGLFVLSFAGVLISFYPYMVPPSLTVWEVAAPASSQWFLLVGAAVLIPIILAYTTYAYWVFRGKVDADTGYH